MPEAFASGFVFSASEKTWKYDTIVKTRRKLFEGKIIKALSGFYYVASEDEIFQTRARGNFRNRKSLLWWGWSDLWKQQSNRRLSLRDLAAKNELVDRQSQMWIKGWSTSLVEPNFSYNLLDRFLVTLEYEGIEPIIFLTKGSCERSCRNESNWGDLSSNWLPRDHVKSRRRRSIGTSTAFLSGSPSLWQSGAGKSTLLNRIVPELALETGVISESLGRKHTTRHVELLPICDGLVADTPGFSSIDFLEIEAVELPKLFWLLAVAANCRFRECMHLNEPDCAVKQVAANEIAETRYKNYVFRRDWKPTSGL